MADRNGTADFAMENLEPPPSPEPGPLDPRPAGPTERARLRQLVSGSRSISAAAAAYSGTCSGGDTEVNNCAHYLSDAFLKAGYSELAPPSNCIEARCGSEARRPVRAKNMHCWFEQMKKNSPIGEFLEEIPKNRGFWAVFQYKESAYSGGHVVIIDTDNNVYYGTGWYGDWSQFSYKF